MARDWVIGLFIMASLALITWLALMIHNAMKRRKETIAEPVRLPREVREISHDVKDHQAVVQAIMKCYPDPFQSLFKLRDGELREKRK